MADEHEHKDGELCRDCGTMKVHRRLLDTDRNYARRLAKIEEHAFRHTMSRGATMRPGCTRIPVVVHVVHRTAAENISQAQIDSQIAVLNDDFRKKNADVSTVPAAFAPLVGDARIEFVLASEDPDGNPTDGVTRTRTNKTSFDSDDEVKFDSSGGKDAWDTSEYLNIWVCNLGGGLLGYAQFPGGPSATDGVVVTHRGFGTTGTAEAPFNKGRTTTHEIGHWLNLRHIWGDDGEGCSGSDFVADTPNQGGPNFGVPSFPSVSCNNGPNGDMFMNYMDYVDDAAMVMFTEGQIARMQACLDGPRSSIGETIPCAPIAVPKPPVKDLIKELPKELPKEFPKEGPKEFPKEGPKELPKDPPKDGPKDNPKDIIKEIPKDVPKDGPKDPPKDFPKEGPKDGIKEVPKELPKEGPKDNPKDIIKEGPFDPGPGKLPFLDPGPDPKGIRDPGPKLTPKESPFDPGPKTPINDPGPGKLPIGDPGPNPKLTPKESPTDPGPKLIDPGPKGIFEGPAVPVQPAQPFQPVQPVQPLQPFQPTINQPFVLGTGGAPGQRFDWDYDERTVAAQHYNYVLATYADLYQRGLLDQQGMMGWQQAYAAYMQLMSQ